MLYRSLIFSKQLQNKLLNSVIPIMVYTTAIRKISSTEITRNITLLSSKKKIKNRDNFKVDNEQDKPLVVMLSWLLAKQKHISKYADFYIKQGFDVINVNITPWQLLWPMKGTQIVASDVLKFLNNNMSYSPLLIHGFSVGGYLWSETLVQMAAAQDRYQHVINRFAGQVWDSLADITEIPEGFPFAVFPHNKVLQSALRKYILYHLKTFDKVATCHYVRASQMFHTNIIKSPALIFVSKSDPVGSLSSNLRLKENWESVGIPVNWKCFDDSPHVMHFYRHPEEYKAELNKFLERIGMLSDKSYQETPSQVKAKL